MLTILTGPDRQAGLSQLIDTICARAAEGIGEQILIVPEQYSFEAERALCRRGGDTISRFAEVLSFTRLASRVFSIYGGVSEEYLDEGGRLLCLYLAAETGVSAAAGEDDGRVSDLLRHPAAASDCGGADDRAAGTEAFRVGAFV